MVTLQNLTELYPTLLDDNIVLPDGLSKDTMKSVIMMRLGLCWPVYDEPEVFSNMLYTWFMAHAWNIERLIKVTETTYAPLENYDRQEDFTDTGSGAKVGSDTNNNTRDLTDTNHNTRDLTDTIDNDTTGSGNSFTTTGGTNTNSVAAYNSTTFQNDNKTETSGTNQVYTSSGGTLDETKRTAGYIDDNKRTAGYIKDERNIKEETSNTGRHAGRAHGNIGVTTTQEMFNQELNLLSGYNLYYTICNWIERDLFIQVY